MWVDKPNVMKKTEREIIDFLYSEKCKKTITKKQYLKLSNGIKSIISNHIESNTCKYSHKTLDFLNCPKYKKYKRGCHNCKCYDIKTMS